MGSEAYPAPRRAPVIGNMIPVTAFAAAAYIVSDFYRVGVYVLAAVFENIGIRFLIFDCVRNTFYRKHIVCFTVVLIKSTDTVLFSLKVNAVSSAAEPAVDGKRLSRIFYLV